MRNEIRSRIASLLAKGYYDGEEIISLVETSALFTIGNYAEDLAKAILQRLDRENPAPFAFVDYLFAVLALIEKDPKRLDSIFNVEKLHYNVCEEKDRSSFLDRLSDSRGFYQQAVEDIDCSTLTIYDEPYKFEDLFHYPRL